MKTLISMTAFVKEQENNEPKAIKFTDLTSISNYQKDAYSKIINYANFLSLTPEIWQFVPCDSDGNVLEEPLLEHFTDCTDEQNAKDYIYNLEKYQTAKERCYFEGFEFVEKYSYGFKLRVAFDDYEEFITILNEETIEDLLTYSVNFDWTLTATAQK